VVGRAEETFAPRRRSLLKAARGRQRSLRVPGAVVGPAVRLSLDGGRRGCASSVESGRGLSGSWPGMWTPLWCSRRGPVCQSGVAGRRLQRPPCGRRAVPAVRVATARCVGTPAPGGRRSPAGGGLLRLATAGRIGTPASAPARAPAGAGHDGEMRRHAGAGGRWSPAGEVCRGSRRRDASVRPRRRGLRPLGVSVALVRLGAPGGQVVSAGEVSCGSRRRYASARPRRLGPRLGATPPVCARPYRGVRWSTGG
jgi:hypothetical protein